MRWIPSLVHMLVHNADVKWVPLSVMTTHGTPPTCHPVGDEGIHARARATEQKLAPRVRQQNGGSFTSLLTGCWCWFSWSSILILRVLCRGYHMLNLKPANDLLTPVGIRLIYSSKIIGAIYHLKVGGFLHVQSTDFILLWRHTIVKYVLR
jgi:hypothetical protein